MIFRHCEFALQNRGNPLDFLRFAESSAEICHSERVKRAKNLKNSPPPLRWFCIFPPPLRRGIKGWVDSAFAESKKSVIARQWRSHNEAIQKILSYLA
ncbi:hypothetical protein ACWIUD_11895 [Helicobacter sp. 23-1044]